MKKKSKGDTWDGIFADPEVGRVLKSKGLIADANQSSIKELATITSLNPSGSWDTSYFYENTRIKKFPELKYCTGLTDTIGTFAKCSSLTEAPIIPEGVTNMRSTFNRCTKLDGVFIIKPVTPPNYTHTFYDVKVVAIYVPDASVNTYKTAEGWSDHSSIIYPMSELPE